MNKDILRNIFSYLPYSEFEYGNLHKVCKMWNNIIYGKNEPGFMTDMIIEKHTSLCLIMKHIKTLRSIHIKYILGLEKWIPFTFPCLRYLYLERCTFDNIKYMIPQKFCSNIKMERCNIDVDINHKTHPNWGVVGG